MLTLRLQTPQGPDHKGGTPNRITMANLSRDDLLNDFIKRMLDCNAISQDTRRWQRLSCRDQFQSLVGGVDKRKRNYGKNVKELITNEKDSNQDPITKLI